MKDGETLPKFEVTEPSTIQKVGRFVVRYLSVFPGEPHDFKSEHFDHAMKWNDPRPDLENYTT